jgi:hypothetical protein
MAVQVTFNFKDPMTAAAFCSIVAELSGMPTPPSDGSPAAPPAASSGLVGADGQPAMSDSASGPGAESATFVPRDMLDAATSEHDAMTACRAMVARLGKAGLATAKEVLATFGATRVSGLRPDQRAAFIAACNQRVA